MYATVVVILGEGTKEGTIISLHPTAVSTTATSTRWRLATARHNSPGSLQHDGGSNLMTMHRQPEDPQEHRIGNGWTNRLAQEVTTKREATTTNITRLKVEEGEATMATTISINISISISISSNTITTGHILMMKTTTTVIMVEVDEEEGVMCATTHIV